MAIEPVWLDHSTPFPPIEQAFTEPDGLLAIGGDLSTERLITAYREGIFPWFNEGEPIFWWSPANRAVLFPEQLKVSRSLRKSIRNKGYTVTVNQAFDQVIGHCAQRPDGGATWISPMMMAAYQQLHQNQIAYSVETWQAERLVGGLYGLLMGCCFFGESMFAATTDASKVAFVYLVQTLQEAGIAFIDCQVSNPHTSSLGAAEIPRKQFQKLLLQYRDHPLPGAFPATFAPPAFTNQMT